MIKYTKTPDDVNKLNSRGFNKRILVWPSEEYKGSWEHLDKTNGPSSRLGLSDVSNIKIAANGICDYARSQGVEYVAIDLEWPLESEDNRFSLALVASTIKDQFLQGQCAGIKLGVYSIPYTAELDVDLKGRFQGHIDFAAPVLYFTHTAATEEGDLTYWQDDSSAKRLIASTWNLPIIPFVAVRRFDNPNLNKPLSPYLVRESFKFVADRTKFDGIIVWDCGCFGIDGTYHPASDPENTSSWSNIQDMVYIALDQMGLTGPNQLTLAYPGAIAFGNVPAGQLANSSVATLTNASSVPVTGITIAASGSAFSIDNTCGSTLNANASCTFIVKFSPAAGQNQSYNGTLQISRDGVSASAITKPLSGTGVVPMPALTFSYPGEINFGNAPAGQTYNSSVATLSNTSDVTASNLNVTASSVFSIGNSNCGTSLAANTSCTFVIRFSPTVGQNLGYNDTLQISANGANTITKALSGVGVVPTPSLAFSYTGDISFGSAPAGQTYNSIVATLSNSSSVAATNLSMEASGVFSIGSNTCGSSLAANTSCTFVIRFSPTAGQNHSYTGTLQINADGASTITRSLSGTGAAPAFALSYTGAINFGNAPAGQSWNSDVTTLTNTGSVAATGLNLTASGVFSIANSNCGTSLAANASCTFVIRFAPTTGQSYTGTLQVSSDNAAPLTRPLSGTGTTP